MYSLLDCPVCCTTLNQPHTLRCGHTICISHLLSAQSSCPVLSCVPSGSNPIHRPHSISIDVCSARVVEQLGPSYYKPAPTLKEPLNFASNNVSDETNLPLDKVRLLENLTCQICLMLLYEPITTPCQHTFCTKCLHRSLDHSSTCPICRNDLPCFAYFQNASRHRFLLRIIDSCFSSEYDARGVMLEQEESDARLDTSIFICQLSFPGMPTLLHFFEPRYRLMLRRCLQTEHPSFGMVMPPLTNTSHGELVDAIYGTMLEIRSVQMLPDGRSMVETWGTHRFRILERDILDGYTVGKVERIDDLNDDALRPEGSPASSSSFRADENITRYLEKESTESSTDEMVKICLNFLRRLRAATAPWVAQRLDHTIGPMPSPEEDFAGFTFWIGMAIPVSEREKAQLLPIRSPYLRLRMCVRWIQHLDGIWWVYVFCLGTFWAPWWLFVAYKPSHTHAMMALWLLLPMGLARLVFVLLDKP